MSDGPLVLMGRHNPEGWPLERLMIQLRYELHVKQAQIVDDLRPQAQLVYANNDRIIVLMQSIQALQEDSQRALKTLGPDQGPTGTPRIGRDSGPQTSLF